MEWVDISMVKYSLIDFFKKASNYEYDYVEASDDGELMINADWIAAHSRSKVAVYIM